MSSIVLDFLSNLDEKKPKKIILSRDLTSKGKIVVLDRQVVKYLTQSEKYLDDPSVTSFISNFKINYDKSCNVITVMSAFYEGGSGNFENESEKRRTAFWDIKGIDKCLEFARVDENYFFKNLKKATHAFTLDSGVQEKNKKFSTIIHKTYEYYLELLQVGFNGASIIEYAKLLKKDMDTEGVSIGDPVAQYCFSLLTNYRNAKEIFKVQGLQNCSEQKILKKIYNVYSDLKVIQFLNGFRSHLAAAGVSGIEVCFISNDGALNQFNSELEKSVQKVLSRRDETGRLEDTYNADINFDIFNPEVFSEKEFEDFKALFWEWADQ